MGISDLEQLRYKFDTKKAEGILSVMQKVRADLQSQLTFEKQTLSSFEHLSPSTRTNVGIDKFNELVSLFLYRFDTTCINHCLETIKVSMLSDKIIRE